MINKINWFNMIQTQASVRSKPRNISPATSAYIPGNDTFEKEKSELQHFEITHIGYMNHDKTPVMVEQNPKDKAVIYEKIMDSKTPNITKIPIEVSIAKSKKNNRTTYHILDKEKNEIGYVTICDWSKLSTLEKDQNPQFLTDYPELGIIGERITIDLLQNNNETIYSGIGEVADQIAIEYCLKEGLTPNIVSIAETGSVISHYKRGRRYFEIEKNTSLDNPNEYGKDNCTKSYESFVSEYGTNNPNEVIEKRLNEAKKYGGYVQCEDLGQLYMYMPQEIIKKYLQRIKENPILH